VLWVLGLECRPLHMSLPKLWKALKTESVNPFPRNVIAPTLRFAHTLKSTSCTTSGRVWLDRATIQFSFFSTCRDLHWEFLRLWTGFELSSSWVDLPGYGLNLNRNILDFMRWSQIDLGAQDLNDIQRPKFVTSTTTPT
jgi:hypothetical protein